MERGELGVSDELTTVFVFDTLLAHCRYHRRETALLRMGSWQKALACWEWDAQVLDHMHDMLARFAARIEVITYRPTGFAQAVHDRLWELEVPVADTISVLSYQSASQRMATDPRIQTVYDGDRAHRFGYGFKAREFVAGQM
jgi:hypothetical protein